MKKIIICILIAAIAMPLMAQEENKQIAFRYFNKYMMDKYDKGLKNKGNLVGGIVLASAGGLTVAGSGLFWAYSDQITPYISEDGRPWSPELTSTVAISAGGLGIGMMVGGIGLALTPNKVEDPRITYNYIYNEQDPVVQEALAAAALKGIADKARIKRQTSFFTNMISPTISIIGKLSINLYEGKEWHNDLLSVTLGAMPNILSAVIHLFTASDEELYYQEYQEAKSAYYYGKD